jgi:hypothetical protein
LKESQLEAPWANFGDSGDKKAWANEDENGHVAGWTDFEDDAIPDLEETDDDDDSFEHAENFLKWKHIGDTSNSVPPDLVSWVKRILTDEVINTNDEDIVHLARLPPHVRDHFPILPSTPIILEVD